MNRSLFKKVLLTPYLRNILAFSAVLLLAFPALNTYWVYPSVQSLLIRFIERDAVQMANHMSAYELMRAIDDTSGEHLTAEIVPIAFKKEMVWLL